MASREIRWPLIMVFLVWMIIVTYLSLTSEPVPGMPERYDKFGHFFLYLITSSLFYIVFKKKFRRVLLYAVLFSVLYGTIMELLQVLIPERSFSFEDITANTSGAIGFLILAKFLTGSSREKGSRG
ncbi:MAG: VanZ family protein [Nitrospirae bacterium]|nr:VanZ family protein [Nitrospirota bacterium]